MNHNTNLDADTTEKKDESKRPSKNTDASANTKMNTTPNRSQDESGSTARVVFLPADLSDQVSTRRKARVSSARSAERHITMVSQATRVARSSARSTRRWSTTPWRRSTPIGKRQARSHGCGTRTKPEDSNPYRRFRCLRPTA